MLKRKIKVDNLIKIILVTSFLMIAAFVYINFRFQDPERFNFPPQGLDQPPTFLLTIQGKEAEEQMDGPLALAVGENNLYVLDSKKHRVSVYDKKGQHLFSIGKKGTGKGEFIYPNAIAVDSRENLYVGEFQAKRIQVFASDGTYLRTLLGTPTTALVPLSMIFHQNKLYVANRTGQVLIYSPDGILINKFGQPGSKEGYLSYPNGIAVDKLGRIFVSDSGNSRVQIFSPGGKFIKVLDVKGTRLNLPRGMAFDELGHLYVVDTFNHEVLVFNDQLNYIFKVGERGMGSGQFNFPNDVAVDSEFRVYVADRENNRIQVFNYR